MLKSIFRSQLTGKRSSRIRSLSQEAYSRLANFSPYGIAGICCQLENFSCILDYELPLDELVRIISETYAEERTKIINHLLLCGGQTHLIRILSSVAEILDQKRQRESKSFLNFWTKICYGRLPEYNTNNSENLLTYLTTLEHELCELSRDCLFVLREICFSITYYSETLSQHPTLLMSLFLLMDSKPLFDHAVGLVDEVLSARNDILSLKEIPNLKRIFKNATNRQLALLCRVLAMAVFEQEECLSDEFSEFLKKSNFSYISLSSLEDMEDESSIANENQFFLLEIEEFLPRLVNLLKMSVFREPPSSSSSSSSSPSTSQLTHVLEENLFRAFRRDSDDIMTDPNYYREDPFGELDPMPLTDDDFPDRSEPNPFHESRFDPNLELAMDEQFMIENLGPRYTPIDIQSILPILTNPPEGPVDVSLIPEPAVENPYDPGSVLRNTFIERFLSGGSVSNAVNNPQDGPGGTSLTPQPVTEARSEPRTEPRTAVTEPYSSSSLVSNSDGDAENVVVNRGRASNGYNFASMMEEMEEEEEQELEQEEEEEEEDTERSRNGIGIWQSFFRWNRGGNRDGRENRSIESSSRNDTRFSSSSVTASSSSAAAAVAPVSVTSASVNASSAASTSTSSVMNAISFFGNLSLFRGRNAEEVNRTNENRNEQGLNEANRDEDGRERQVSTIADEVRAPLPPMRRFFESFELSESLYHNTPTPLPTRPFSSSSFLPIIAPFTPSNTHHHPTQNDHGMNANINNQEYGNRENEGEEEEEQYLETYEELPNEFLYEHSANDDQIQNENVNANVNANMNVDADESGQEEVRRVDVQNEGDRTRQEIREGIEDLRRTLAQRNHDLYMIAMTSHLVEVLFVMCSLCGGKKKEEVQRKLHQLGLFNILNQMFDLLDWFSSPPVSPPESHGIHGPGCACNPKSALKVQYLRLVHNFFDRDPHKMVTPTNRMMNGMMMENNFGFRNEGDRIRASVRSVQTENNLVLKITHVLMQLSDNSPYRFWLASSIESFLRGSDPRDQRFVARTGIMRHLLHSIMKDGFRCSSSLQISFDLLGEIIKFNPSLFAKLNDYFSEEEQEQEQETKGDMFHRFIEVMASHLVDSNVFIRSVLISLEYFRVGRPSPPHASFSPFPSSSSSSPSFMPKAGSMSASPSPSPSSDKILRSSIGHEGYTIPHSYNRGHGNLFPPFHLNCKIADFMRQNSVRLLFDLMKTVKPSEVNQDNICVLNTALVFFIFADRKNQLVLFLKELRVLDGLESMSPFIPLSEPIPEPLFEASCHFTAGHVLHNFRSLLNLWRKHYAKKRRGDCANLQYSTNVPFEEWVRVVDLLCSEPDQPTSLVYKSPSTSTKFSCASVPNLEEASPLRPC